MTSKFVLVGPNGERVIFRPNNKQSGLFMVNNQPFPVEEARRRWRRLCAEGYRREREQLGQAEDFYPQIDEADQDMYYYDPVAAGYDGLNSEYWSAVGENADPDNHWGYAPDEQDEFSA